MSISVVKCSWVKCGEVLLCSDGTSNKVSNVIRRHIDNRKLLLIYILLLSYSFIFFRFYFFYQYMVVFLFNTVICVFYCYVCVFLLFGYPD
jgi:hypothetical protein